MGRKPKRYDSEEERLRLSRLVTSPKHLLQKHAICPRGARKNYKCLEHWYRRTWKAVFEPVPRLKKLANSSGSFAGVQTSTREES